MEKENKRDIIRIIIVTIAIIVLLVALIIGIKTIISKIKKETKLPDWGEKYYDYLKDFKTSSKTTKLLAKNNLELKDEYQGEFYTYDKQLPPAMILQYTEPAKTISEPDKSSNPGLDVEPLIPDEREEISPLPTDPIEPIVGKNYIVIVLLIDGELQEFVFEAESLQIELLYNIEEKEYFYYIMYQLDGSTHFIKVNDYLKSLIDDSFEYEETIIEHGETIEVDGEVVLKIDTIFYEPTNVKGVYFKFNPSDTEGLKDTMATYYDNIEDEYKKLTDGKTNGLDNHIDKYFVIIIEIYGDDWIDDPNLEIEPKPEPEEPGKVEPEPEPEPDPGLVEPTPACEDGYVLYKGECHDEMQLVKPGGCGYANEVDGRCYYFTCLNDDNSWNYACEDAFDKPNPGECPPDYNYYNGYCFSY